MEERNKFNDKMPSSKMIRDEKNQIIKYRLEKQRVRGLLESYLEEGGTIEKEICTTDKTTSD